MMLNKTVIGAAVAAAFMSALPAQAQSAKDFEEMRAEIRRLRAEVDALKKGAPAAVPAPAVFKKSRLFIGGPLR